MHPISKILLDVYTELAERENIPFSAAPEHANKIDSIVKTVHGTYFGVSRFPTSEDKIAAYFYLIIKDHPVVDGNKRLAVLWTEILSNAFGVTIVTHKEPASVTTRVALDALAVAVEKTDVPFDQIFPVVKYLLFNGDKVE